MLNFLIFCLAVVGMTHIMTNGAIMQWYRDLADKFLPAKISELVHCNQCSGFWCGLFCGAALFPPTYWLDVFAWLRVFMLGCAGSFLASLMAQVLNLIETKTLIDLDELKGQK